MNLIHNCCAAESVCSSGKASFRSADSELHVGCGTASSVSEEMGQLQWYWTHLEEQYKLETENISRRCSLPDSATMTDSNLCENIQKLRAQYRPEPADLSYKFNGLLARMAIYYSSSGASSDTLRVSCVDLEAYRSSSVSWHLYL